jgi:quercetin dioxygenase-like cupin family protein
MNDFLHIPDLNRLVKDVQPDSIFSRTIYNDNGVKIVLFAFADGQSLSEHTSASRAFIHVIHGEAEITIQDFSDTAGPGAWFYLPPEIPHSVSAHSEMHMLLYLIKPGD